MLLTVLSVASFVVFDVGSRTRRFHGDGPRVASVDLGSRQVRHVDIFLPRGHVPGILLLAVSHSSCLAVFVSIVWSPGMDAR